MIPETDTDGVVLEGVEPDALAWRLMSRLAGQWSEHIDWADVPMLAEGSWSNVAEHMDKIAAFVHDHADVFDRTAGVDSRYLLDCAENEPLQRWAPLSPRTTRGD